MKLNIQVTVNSGDDHIQTEILENRKRFKQEHTGHDTELSLDTTNRTTKNYFVNQWRIQDFP